jgi:hypothetical protein
MRKLKICLMLSMIILITHTQGLGQEAGDEVTYRIQTVQGNEFIGTIAAEQDDHIVLITEAFGEIRILKSDIRRRTVVQVDKLIEGVFWDENPQSSRYLWSPNGYGLKKDEGYYQNIWVLYNQVSYGFSDNFSMSAGMIPLFLFGGIETPVWIVPKFSIPIEKEKINVAAGAFIGGIVGLEESRFGIVFGTTTYGSRDSNVNFGLGWGYAFDGWADRPMINISFLQRTGPKGYFISENYYFGGDGFNVVVLSLGGRRIINTVGLDFALAIPLGTDIDTFIALPFLGLTIPFGNWKPEAR